MKDLIEVDELKYKDKNIEELIYKKNIIWENLYTIKDQDLGNENGFDFYLGARKNVKIPERLKGRMVQNCSYLFSPENSSHVTDVNKVILKHDKVINMRGMFWKFRLNKLKLNLNTSNVNDMIGMFAKAINLEELDLSSFDTSKVERTNGMFADCTSLKKVNLKSFKTMNVNNMMGMFNGCKSLEELDLSSFDTSRVDKHYGFYGIFLGCFNLKTVYCRTAEDANNFKTAGGTPVGINFIVKGA